MMSRHKNAGQWPAFKINISDFHRTVNVRTWNSWNCISGSCWFYTIFRLAILNLLCYIVVRKGDTSGQVRTWRPGQNAGSGRWLSSWNDSNAEALPAHGELNRWTVFRSGFWFEDHTSLIPQKARLTIDDRSQAAEMTPDCMYRRMQQSGVISCDGSGERRFALTFFWHFFDIFRLIWYNIWKLRSCVLFSSRIT